MGFEILNLDNVTEEELIACIEKNIMEATLTRKEITNLKKSSISNHSKAKKAAPVKDEITQFKLDKDSAKEDFEDEVDYYHVALNKLTNKNLSEMFFKILPSRKNTHYQKLILRLQAEVLKDIKELTEFIKDENLTLREMQEIKDEILFNQQKFQLFTSVLLPQEELTDEQEKSSENRLIFVPTATGKIRIFSEIDSMPLEYYPELSELFLSIKNGTFKGVKRFQGENYGSVSEVRGKMLRVVFDRLDKNSYAILTVFAKKFQITAAYRSSLESIIQSYLPMEETLVKKLEDEEFLTLHHDYEVELMQKLSPIKNTCQPKQKVMTNE